MSEITVAEVRVLRKALERDIRERIDSFESITRTKVRSIHVSRTNTPRLANLDVTHLGSSSRESVLTGIEISITS